MNKTIRTTGAALSLTSILLSSNVMAVDTDPRDYTALPEGVNLSLLYMQSITADTLKINGETISNDADLDAQIGIYRFVHFTKLFGKTIDPQVLIPFGNQDLGLTGGETSGLADTIFAATVWLHEDAAKGSYFGITPFLFAPLGEYDSDSSLNLGTNRWSFALQGGYITRLTENLELDVTADVQWYGTNDDPFGGDKLKQDETYQVQVALSYDFNPRTYAHVEYSLTKGGERTLDGVEQGDNVDTTEVVLGINYWAIEGKLQLQGQYKEAISVDEFGLETEAFQLRFLYLF